HGEPASKAQAACGHWRDSDGPGIRILASRGRLMMTMRRRILMGILPLTSVALIATAVGLERAVYYDLLGALDAQLQNLARTIGGSIGVEVDGGVEFELGSAIET